MALLVGVEYCKVDAQGRIKMPVALKKQLELSEDLRFFVRRSIYSECLELFTYEAFQIEVGVLQKSLNPYDPESKRLYRRFIEGNMIELDGFDRLLLPDSMRKQVHITKDVVLLGAGNYLEIWNKEAYEKTSADSFDYQQAAKKLLSKTEENDR